MLAILSIIIGIVFVLLLFSMLVSAMVELIHAVLSSRGKHLRYTLESMLGEKADDFLKHPFFRQLAYATRHRNVTSYISPYSFPSWINKSTFSAILADILNKEEGGSLSEKINSLKDRELKELLLYLHNQTADNPAVFEKRVEGWFDEVMARAKDWFTRATKWRLLGYGLLLAFAYNVDTIQIYKSLSTNAAIRGELVKAAGIFSEGRDSLDAKGAANLLDARANLVGIRETFVQSVQSPLGLGWHQNIPNNWLDWLIKLAGLAITGVAVTLGAPFWFDLLKKLLSLQSGSANASPEPRNVGEAKEPANETNSSVFNIKPTNGNNPEIPAKSNKAKQPAAVG